MIYAEVNMKLTLSWPRYGVNSERIDFCRRLSTSRLKLHKYLTRCPILPAGVEAKCSGNTLPCTMGFYGLVYRLMDGRRETQSSIPYVHPVYSYTHTHLHTFIYIRDDQKILVTAILDGLRTIGEIVAEIRQHTNFRTRKIQCGYESRS